MRAIVRVSRRVRSVLGVAVLAVSLVVVLAVVLVVEFAVEFALVQLWHHWAGSAVAVRWAVVEVHLSRQQ